MEEGLALPGGFKVRPSGRRRSELISNRPEQEVGVRKGASTLLLMGLAGSPALAALDEQSPTLSQAVDGSVSSARPACKNDDPKTVVVCGRSQQRYRIDPDVLAATRQAEALPLKPQLDATTSVPCSGPNCGGGSYVPLV